MYSKFNATDIVRYTKDGRLYVIWGVDAGSYTDKYIHDYNASYSIMLKNDYDRLDPKNPDYNIVITHNIKEEDLRFISK